MAEAQLIADYADLGVSCGYIGNVGIGIGDDRRFYVFTRLKHAVETQQTRYQSLSVHVQEVRDEKKKVIEVVFDTPAVRQQLDALRARLLKGELFLPVQKTA
jgi:hypothetical protein